MRRVLVALLVLAALMPMQRATSAAPSMQVIVEPRDGIQPLVAFINAARHSLDGEVSLAGAQPILGALEAAARRGIVVRISLEQHPSGTGGAAPALVYKSLATHRVQVRWTSSSFASTHAGYLIADKVSAWIGTMDWTTAAFTRNREFAVIDTDASTVAQIASVFAADWGHTDVKAPTGSLVLSPVNARSVLGTLILRAHGTLDVYTDAIQDRDLIDDLETASANGVRVRIIYPGGTAGDLAQTDVQIVTRGAPYIHARVIVADGSTVYLGSTGLSTTSLDRNRELGILSHDTRVISAVEAAFAQDLGGARAAPPPPYPTVIGDPDTLTPTPVTPASSAAPPGIPATPAVGIGGPPLNATSIPTAIPPSATIPPFSTPAPTAAGAVPGTQGPAATGTPFSPTDTPTPSATSSPTDTLTPSPTSSVVPTVGTLGVDVSVQPNPMLYGAYPKVTIHTVPNASCDIKVVYDGGGQPASYPEHSSTSDGSGTITEQGQWHMVTSDVSGDVLVQCSLDGATGSGSAHFTALT